MTLLVKRKLCGCRRPVHQAAGGADQRDVPAPAYLGGGALERFVVGDGEGHGSAASAGHAASVEAARPERPAPPGRGRGGAG